jgi:hypothetical protein
MQLLPSCIRASFWLLKEMHPNAIEVTLQRWESTYIVHSKDEDGLIMTQFPLLWENTKRVLH